MAGEAFSESKFSELELCDELKRGVEKLEFQFMTPIQAAAIPVLLTGRDVIGQAQTGTGKTAAFGLPILEKIDKNSKKLQAVILCPTRELAMQVTDDLRSFATYMQDVKILSVYGGADINRQIQGLKGTQIVVGTPGRVMDHMRRHTIKLDDVTICVLDEADEMLKMGFREDMEVILGAVDHPHQTCLFSATMPQEILDITGNFQNDPEFIKITPQELTIDRIEQYYYPVKREYKIEALIRLIEYYQYNRSIVFCNTKSMTDQLASTLKADGYTAEALHGDLMQKQRDVVMNDFRNGTINILIATDIAARGIDVDDVEAVFNFDIPQETEYYVHRIGRTGRAGKLGVSHTLCNSREFGKIHAIEDICHSKMEERTIPSSVQINDSKIHKMLVKVAETINTEGGTDHHDLVAGYCAKHDIDPVDFAAAMLKMELGDPTEELELNLYNPNGKKRRGGRDGSGRGERNGRDVAGRGERSSRGGRDEGRDGRSGSGRGKHSEGGEGRSGRADGDGRRGGRGEGSRRGEHSDRDGEVRSSRRSHDDNVEGEVRSKRRSHDDAYEFSDDREDRWSRNSDTKSSERHSRRSSNADSTFEKSDRRKKFTDADNAGSGEVKKSRSRKAAAGDSDEFKTESRRKSRHSDREEDRNSESSFFERRSRKGKIDAKAEKAPRKHREAKVPNKLNSKGNRITK